MDYCSLSQKRRRSGRIKKQEIMENLGANDSLINKLPDDCLKHIFSFLPILERLEAEKVCKRWRIIGERGWHDIKTLSIDRKYSDHTIYLIFKRCDRFLRKLKIHESREQSEDRLAMIIDFCKLDQLEDIEIGLEYRISYDECLIRNVRRIFAEARKLVAVTIKECDLLDSNLGCGCKFCQRNSTNFPPWPEKKHLDLTIISYDDDAVFHNRWLIPDHPLLTLSYKS